MSPDAPRLRILGSFVAAVALGCTASPGPSAPPDNGPPGPPTMDAASGGNLRKDGATADARATEDDVALPQDDGGPGSDTAAPAGGAFSLTVNAGAHERKETIVTFALPADVGAGKLFTLVDGSGGRSLLQAGEGGRATFVLPALKAGAQATFTAEPLATPPPGGGVSVMREPDGVNLFIAGTAVFRYQMKGKLPAGIGQNYLRGGYIHPIFSPTGVPVTGDYPGDHRHHHGLWSAWAHSVFAGHDLDFWNMGGGSAKVDFDSLGATWEGPVHGGLRTRQVHVDLRGPQPRTALTEDWVVTVYKTGASTSIFDVDSSQDATGNLPVMLAQYIYGGFALRGHAQWSAAATFLTSEGKTRGNGDGSKARWCYIGGRVDGKDAGTAMLGHPTNFRAPQPVRINPDDPFFSYAPVREGGFPIVPGKPYVSRFRFVVTDGAPDKDLLDRLWNDYADPPAVTVAAAP